MAAWWIVFLSFDIALMGAIFYVLAFRKNRFRPAVPATAAKVPAVKDPAPSILMELKEELVSVRKTAADLEKKRIELDAFDRGLRERYIKLDEMLKKAASLLVHVEDNERNALLRFKLAKIVLGELQDVLKEAEQAKNSPEPSPATR